MAVGQALQRQGVAGADAGQAAVAVVVALPPQAVAVLQVQRRAECLIAGKAGDRGGDAVDRGGDRRQMAVGIAVACADAAGIADGGQSAHAVIGVAGGVGDGAGLVLAGGDLAPRGVGEAGRGSRAAGLDGGAQQAFAIDAGVAGLVQKTLLYVSGNI